MEALPVMGSQIYMYQGDWSCFHVANFLLSGYFCLWFKLDHSPSGVHVFFGGKVGVSYFLRDPLGIFSSAFNYGHIGDFFKGRSFFKGI